MFPPFFNGLVGRILDMDRRYFILGICSSVMAPSVLRAHTPYRQWKVMRERFLLIHSHRADLGTDRVAEQAAEVLKNLLPKAQARVARARDQLRIGSLITTGQAMIAVLHLDEAERLYKAEGEFSELQGGAIRAIAINGDYVVISADELPSHHAWLLTSALTAASDEDPKTFDATSLLNQGGVPLHPGATAYLKGEELESQQ